MTKQVTRKQIADFLRLHTRLSKRQRHRFLLQCAFRLLPGLTAEQIILSHHIDQFPERAFTFLCSRHTGTLPDINRPLRHKALASRRNAISARSCFFILLSHEKPPCSDFLSSQNESPNTSGAPHVSSARNISNTHNVSKTCHAGKIRHVNETHYYIKCAETPYFILFCKSVYTVPVPEMYIRILLPHTASASRPDPSSIDHTSHPQ